MTPPKLAATGSLVSGRGLRGINRTLKEHAVQILRDAIMEGRLKPGERIDEVQLARQLGVSRTPLREALLELEQQGLVLSRRRQGTFVVELAGEEIEKVNSLRI